MSREDPQLKIRLPLELKEKITQSAADHGRSINSEVVARLEQSFANDEKPSNQYVDISKALGLIFDEIQDLKNNTKKWVIFILNPDSPCKVR